MPAPIARLLGLATAARIRFAGVALLASHLAILAAMFATARGGRTAFGPGLGADYAGFYTAATILDQYPADRLYDTALQDRLYHRLLPGIPPDETLLYAHAPLLASLLRPLARLPYAWSYAAWLAIAAGLILAALGLALRVADAIPTEDRATGWLLALTFQPLLMEGWLGGQMSALGLFWVAVAFACERAGRPFGFGAALAMCLYKPTLLLLALPMLAVAGRWRAWLGFVATGLVLAGATLLAVGWPCCAAYLRLLLGYARHTTAGAAGFRVIKHVDINSFFTLLLGGSSPISRAAAVATAAVAAAVAIAAWWGVARRGAGDRLLLLCGVSSGAMVFNLYTPVYDVAVVLPGVVMTADALRRRAGPADDPYGPGSRMLLALLVLVPWVTQALARKVGFQPLTVVLLALGLYQLAMARRGDRGMSR